MGDQFHPVVSVNTRSIAGYKEGMGAVKSGSVTMGVEFRKKCWIKFSNHSSPPNQQARERDWD